MKCATDETPCGAFGRAGLYGVLRLRLCLAFRDAQPSLRMTARRGSLRLGFEEKVLVELGWDGGFRAVDFAQVFAGFVICYVIVAGLEASQFYLAGPMFCVEGVVHFFSFADGVGFG